MIFSTGGKQSDLFLWGFFSNSVFPFKGFSANMTSCSLMFLESLS